MSVCLLDTLFVHAFVAVWGFAELTEAPRAFSQLPKPLETEQKSQSAVFRAFFSLLVSNQCDLEEEEGIGLSVLFL